MIVARLKIELHYWRRILKIQADKHYSLARITLAGKFIRLAFWISPDLKRELAKGFNAYDEEACDD